MDNSTGESFPIPGAAAPCSSASGSNSTNPENTDDNHDIQSPQPIENPQRATDLLLSVSVSSEINKAKIFRLSSKAVRELVEMARPGSPFWRHDSVRETQVFDEDAYHERFGPQEITLEVWFRMILSGRAPDDFPKHNPVTDIRGRDIRLKREVSRATGNISRNPVFLVNMLMDAVQWSSVFSNMVSSATVLGVLSTGQPGNPNGAVHVMRAVFHFPTPRFPAREFKFARYCRQLNPNTWVVVDVSLETLFDQNLERFQRKPSGVLIQGLGDGSSSRITWMEHNFVDNKFVHNQLRRIMDSGLAFCARRWVAKLEKLQ